LSNFLFLEAAINISMGIIGKLIIRGRDFRKIG
jgi:hypothetical protein